MAQTPPPIPTAADVAALTCPYCPRPFDPDSNAAHMREAHPDEMRALGERLARYGRRRRAAERGENWTVA
jgi:hypothetical protein